MKSTQLQLVTHKQAQHLYALGFNLPCSDNYNINGELEHTQKPYSNSKRMVYGDISAPSVAVAIGWIRNRNDEGKLLDDLINLVETSNQLEVINNKQIEVKPETLNVAACFKMIQDIALALGFTEIVFKTKNKEMINLLTKTA